VVSVKTKIKADFSPQRIQPTMGLQGKKIDPGIKKAR
jgi:hypothetical protein